MTDTTALTRDAAELPTSPAPQSPPRVVMPPADVIRTEEGYRLEADLPGVSAETLELTVEEQVLLIEGERAAAGGRRVVYRRSFRLTPDVDLEALDAVVEHGVLTVTLPLKEQARPRKIAIRAA